MGPPDFNKTESDFAKEFFKNVVTPYVEKYNADLETMAERMITDPKQRGIFVTRYSDLTWKMELTKDVPFGHCVEQTVYYPQH